MAGPHALQIVSVLPLAAVHTLGNLLTNVSLGHVAVSFTHTIKARPLLHPGSAALAVRPSLQVILPSLQSCEPPNKDPASSCVTRRGIEKRGEQGRLASRKCMWPHSHSFAPI